uniref:Uncharacterized protein n=1 Tax=Cyanophora biloba TaxID=1489483 RepID=A0A2Z4HGH0_9EUKA|nr:hypothetical protein [Cyanophora biloba]AWW13886.1 hypothetical protein [Cyanophora biloba]
MKLIFYLVDLKLITILIVNFFYIFFLICFLNGSKKNFNIIY